MIFPLTFASSAFVPDGLDADWLQAFADVNPFTTIVDAMRALWIGDPAGNDVWGAVAWSIGLIAVFAPLSVARYRRAVSTEQASGQSASQSGDVSRCRRFRLGTCVGRWWAGIASLPRSASGSPTVRRAERWSSERRESARPG